MRRAPAGHYEAHQETHVSFTELQPPYQQPQPAGPPAAYAPPPQVLRTEPLAIWGFVCAFVFWPVGLVLSIMASKRVKSSGDNGHGLALAGLIVSIVAGLTSIAIAAFAVLATLALGTAAVSTISELDAQGAFDAPTTSVANALESTKLDLALTATNVAGEAFRAESGEFPTATELPDLGLEDVVMSFGSSSPDQWCIDATTATGTVTRHLATFDTAPSDGPCTS
jgi:hypothetical protein